jgi:hypothetical protein
MRIMARRATRAASWAGALLAAVAPMAMAQEALSTRVLDDFSDPAPWTATASNQVSATLAAEDGALCLAYDFNGVSGHAAISRALPMEYPDNYRFDLRLRGRAPDNDFQFKLVDASGDNVWWVNRLGVRLPADWTTVSYKARHIDKAWGPDPERRLLRSARIEFTIYNRVGGRGRVCFDQLDFATLAPADDAPLAATALAAVGEAAAAVDGDLATHWTVPRVAGGHRLVLDLGRVREFGGLVLDWAEGAHASDYAVSVSTDGVQWREAARVAGANGGRDYVAMPESEARLVAIDLAGGPGPRFALAEATLRPLAFSAHRNDTIAAVAGDAPRGWFPRGFIGEQPYWTIVGVDGGLQQGLLGEDGALEVARGGFSLEPFVRVDGALVTWADVRTRQSLQDNALPIPSVDWTHPAFSLRTTAFAQGNAASSQLVGRYRLANTGATPRDYEFALAVRPLQVNPPRQFLNTIGGASTIGAIAVDGGTVSIDGTPRVFARRTPDAAFATPFHGGMAVEHLARGRWPATTRVERDPTGFASGALVYRIRLAPGEVRDIEVMVPLTGSSAPARRWWEAAALQDEVAAAWRAKLGSVRIDVPPEGQALADTLRTSLAHMLVSRIGARLQPGTRSYSRSWIRDGAMISEGLLRLGRADVVRDYIEWYAPYQFDDGMVPCCVDDRGSDPVPENDSHGELVFTIAEYWRYTRDDDFARRMWPHVLAAYRYMEALRASERTEENRARDPAFYGMMPASISHEGYSAKPMHSYWDNFWALRGYKDAAELAAALGQPEAAEIAASRDAFRADLLASLDAAMRRHGIAYLPGAAELGDFDATSTTIALAPGGELANLPREAVEATFGRYWQEFAARRDGTRAWKDYTPYEWRNVAAFVRLGWRQRAVEASDWLFADRAPPAWNQWAEVVTPTPRVPFFLGDLPHAWVGSDFVRSALDMFAYPRESDDSLVLAAGLPPAWFDGDGVAIDGLRTWHGALAYRIQRRGDGVLVVEIPAGSAMPPGGLVFPWPGAGAPGQATRGGVPMAWEAGELRIRELPARIEIQPGG